MEQTASGRSGRLPAVTADGADVTGPPPPDPPDHEETDGDGTSPVPVDPTRHPDIVALVSRTKSLLADRHRVLVGLTGPSGAGKTMVAEAFVSRLRVLGTSAVVVPMDGFHLDQREIVRLGRAGRDWAPDTIDVGGYVSLLERLRAADEPVVLAPRFDHELRQPIGSALPVLPAVRVVVTVGEYLLVRHSDLGRPASDAVNMTAWNRVRGLLDTCWFVAADEAARGERLLARYLAHGLDPEAAASRIAGTDEAYAPLVQATRSRADGVVAWGAPTAS